MWNEIHKESWEFATVYNVSQKQDTYTRVDNFVKYLAIFKMISLLDSAQNLLQNDHYISNHILKTLMLFNTLWNSHYFKNCINSTTVLEKRFLKEIYADLLT